MFENRRSRIVHSNGWDEWGERRESLAMSATIISSPLDDGMHYQNSFEQTAETLFDKSHCLFSIHT